MANVNALISKYGLNSDDAADLRSYANGGDRPKSPSFKLGNALKEYLARGISRSTRKSQRLQASLRR